MAAVCLVLALLATGCGRQRPSAEPAATTGEDPLGSFEESLSGHIRIDGSSTVAPLMTLAAERFRREEPGVRISVGVSGTGGGFERFCRGETELSDASRRIEDEETAVCQKHGVRWLEVQVANDGLSVVVNADNDWATCLTVEQLRRIWEPGSKVDSWRDVDTSFPDDELSLYGPGTDSGTFDYFTDAIVGEEGKSRSDYNASEDDNVIVRGVSTERGALGYLGLSYLLENHGALKAAAVDGGGGCVTPGVRTVQDGRYKPLSRPLFTYLSLDALAEKQALEPFLTFLLDNEPRLARGAKFVPMTTAQLDQATTALEAAGNAG